MCGTCLPNCSPAAVNRLSLCPPSGRCTRWQSRSGRQRHDGLPKDTDYRGAKQGGQDCICYGIPTERSTLPHLHQRRSHSGRPESISTGPGRNPVSQGDAELDLPLCAERGELRLRDHLERTRLCSPDPPLESTGLLGKAVLPALADAGDGHRPCEAAGDGGWTRCTGAGHSSPISCWVAQLPVDLSGFGR